MAKKPTMIIEYRYDKSDAWTEYTRTQVPSLVDHYITSAKIDYPGADVRDRKLP